MHKRDHLNITAEELDQVEKKKTNISLEITSEELDMMNHIPGGQSGKHFPPVEGLSPSPDMEKKKANVWEKVQQLVPTGVGQMLVAGLVGALAAWIVNELVFDFRHEAVQDAVIRVGLWGALTAAIIGFFFGAVQDFLNRHHKRAVLSGLKWSLGAAAGGFLGGALGQYFYGLLDGGSPSLSMGLQIFTRTLGWGLLGAGFGLGHGGMTMNRKRFFNGLIGGVIGGAIGGLLFDFVAMAITARDGAASRLVGFIALGGVIGFMIGLVEHLRREAWMAAEGGPMKGKQFILFGESTTFGSSGKSDIILFGDPSVPPRAFQIEQSQEGTFALHALTAGYGIQQNHMPVQYARLRNGDYIRCGKHSFLFHEKVIR